MQSLRRPFKTTVVYEQQAYSIREHDAINGFCSSPSYNLLTGLPWWLQILLKYRDIFRQSLLEEIHCHFTVVVHVKSDGNIYVKNEKKRARE